MESLWGEEFDPTDRLIDKFGRAVFRLSDDSDSEIEKIFQYYRNTGYPNYLKEEYDLKYEFLKLKSFPDSELIDNKDLKQVMTACGVLWTYFPHWIEVECSDGKSLKELWDDDTELKNLIRLTYNWEKRFGNGFFTINRLRQNAKIYLSKQSVSNFRPTVAKYIYNTYGNSGTVWDMSCGFGGRLMGFYASNCKVYYGTDPSTKTFDGLKTLYEDLQQFDTTKEVHLLKQGSEIEPPVIHACDLCFTSPPYFNTEKYSEEDTQSYKKYETSDRWVNGFLRDTIINCNKALKDTVKLIININDVKSAKNLTSETLRIASECGFVLSDTLNLILSSCVGNGVKIEPVYIFDKVKEI